MGFARRVIAASLLASLVLGGLASTVGATPSRHVSSASASVIHPIQSSSSSKAVSLASTSDAGGNDFVFWKGQDANLWMAVYTAASSSWSGTPIAVPGAWPLASEPSATTVSIAGTEYVYVFWESPGAGLAYDYATVTLGGAGTATSVGPWSGVLSIGAVAPLASAPSATYVTVGGLQGVDVFWTGTDGNLWSVVLSGAGGPLSLPSGSSGPTKIGDGPLGSAPSAGSDAGGNVFVFWQGIGNNTHVWEGWYDAGTSTWIGPIDLGAWTGDTGSPPSVAIGAYGRQYIFWQGQDGNLYYADWNGYWTGWIYVGDGPLNSAPSAVVTSGVAGYTPASSFMIVWKGTDLNMWFATYKYQTATWTGPDTEAYGPLDS